MWKLIEEEEEYDSLDGYWKKVKIGKYIQSKKVSQKWAKIKVSSIGRAAIVALWKCFNLDNLNLANSIHSHN